MLIGRWPCSMTDSSSRNSPASFYATLRQDDRRRVMGPASRLPSIRSGARVVLVLAGSAIASLEPLRIPERPSSRAAAESTIEPEADADARAGRHDERVEWAPPVGGNPVAAHIRTDDPALVDEIVHAN